VNLLQLFGSRAIPRRIVGHLLRREHIEIPDDVAVAYPTVRPDRNSGAPFRSGKTFAALPERLRRLKNE